MSSDLRRRGHQQEEGGGERREEREPLEWKQGGGNSGAGGGGGGNGNGNGGEGDKNNSSPKNEDAEQTKKVLRGQIIKREQTNLESLQFPLNLWWRI